MHSEQGRPDTRESIVKEYLQSMRQLVESQKQVMLQYLGSEAQTVRVVEAAPAQPTLKAVPVTPAETKAAAVVAPAPEVHDIKLTVLQVVSQKTGYPSEMLDLDQDMEADLSIDSIKRFEIIADLGERLGQGRGQLEKLASMKTLRQMISALETQQKPAPAPAAPAPAAISATPAPEPRI